MNPSMRLAVVCLAVLAGGVVSAHDVIDSKLLGEIQRIRAIDNHMHADAVDASRPDRWKAGNPLGVPRYPDVLPLARDNPEWRLSWKALYGYRHDDAELAHLQALLAGKRKAMAENGPGWPVRVLDAAGVEIALVNTVKRGVGLDNSRFRWVPYAEPLLAPFAPGRAQLLYSGGDVTLQGLLDEAGLKEMPATLADYREKLIRQTLARWHQQGAVAIKFLTAYRRAMDFDCGTVEPDDLFRKGSIGADDRAADLLDAFLFCEIAEIAGQEGLAVHIHTGNGDGPYFNNDRADPSRLERVLNHKRLRKTSFVLLHGGWPNYLVTQAMIDKPNTYADFSAQTFYLSTHGLSEVLRSWLSWHPEKVLFGSDAYSDVDSPLVDWEEKEWLLTHKSRRALAIALTAMVADGEITRERAGTIARMVLRDNAAKLYGLELR